MRVILAIAACCLGCASSNDGCIVRLRECQRAILVYAADHDGIIVDRLPRSLKQIPATPCRCTAIRREFIYLASGIDGLSPVFVKDYQVYGQKTILLADSDHDSSSHRSSWYAPRTVHGITMDGNVVTKRSPGFYLTSKWWYSPKEVERK